MPDRIAGDEHPAYRARLRASRWRGQSAALFMGASLSGCSHAITPPEPLAFTLDFDHGAQGFVADFADYPPEHAEIYELTADYRAIPPPLDSRSALFISGVNRSDDLFMFYRGALDGLTPGARYAATVSVEIATDTPSGCLGVGGAPGESVWIKAGASAVVPPDGRARLLIGADSGFESRTQLYFTRAAVTLTPL